MDNPEPISQSQIYFCLICNGPGTTKHHFVPRQIEKQVENKPRIKYTRLCGPCHGAVHKLFKHKELATKFNTDESLKAEFNIRAKILTQEDLTKLKVKFTSTKIKLTLEHKTRKQLYRNWIRVWAGQTATEKNKYPPIDK